MTYIFTDTKGGGRVADLRIETNPDQALVMAVPWHVDLCLAGTRGWGKTWLIVVLAIMFCVEHGGRARCLLVRRTYGALLDLEDTLRSICAAMFGAAAEYRRSDRTMHLPGGGRIELSQVESREHYYRFQGREFGFIGVDEVTQFPDPSLVDLLRASLRAPEGVPVRFVVAGNYTGPGLSWFKRRYITGRPRWLPYTEPHSGRETVTAAGRYSRNPHIDRQGFEAQLAAAAGGRDTPLFRAWAKGDPNVIESGGYFDDVDLERVTLPGELYRPEWLRGFEDLPRNVKFPRHRWKTLWSVDHGHAAPAVALLAARPPYHEPSAPDGRRIHRDAWLILDEVALHARDDLNQGLYLDVPDVTHYVLDASERWGVKPTAVLDAACFAKHGHRGGTSIADEYEDAGLDVRPSAKGSRVAGWQKLRRMLAADDPLVLVSSRCRYLIETLRTAPRDERNPDDVDTASPDHALDALRYLITTTAVTEGGLTGRPWKV